MATNTKQEEFEYKLPIPEEDASPAVVNPYINLALAVVVQSLKDLHADLYYSPHRYRQFEKSLDAYRFLLSADCLFYLHAAGINVDKSDVLKAMAKGMIINKLRGRKKT